MTKGRPFAGAFLAAFARRRRRRCAQDVTTLNFLSAQQDNVVQPMIEAFEKRKNPDIKVVHQSVPFNDLNTATESRIGQGDTSIDLVHADTPRMPGLRLEGYLLKLDDRRARHRGGGAERGRHRAGELDGSLYAYPMWTSTQLLFYNKDLLEKAGVEPPSTDPQDRADLGRGSSRRPPPRRRAGPSGASPSSRSTATISCRCSSNPPAPAPG